MQADDIPRLLRELGTDKAPTEREWQSFAQLAHRSLRIRRAMVAGLASVLALTGIVSAANLLVGGDRPEPSPPVDEPLPVPPPTPSPEPSPRPTPSPEQEASPDDAEEAVATVELWYSIETDAPTGPGLFVVHRDLPSTQAIGAATLRAWIEGPSPEEEAAGIMGGVPEGTELLGLEIENGTAIVDLSAEFERTGMGTFGEGMLLDQLAWTITQFPTVDRALLRIEGEQKPAYLGHGFIIDEENPLERGSRASLAPILVYEPGAGNGFASGDVVQGTADVFEANVLIRVRGEDGSILFEDFTTATCGTGCRGDYSKTVHFDIGREQPGTIEVFEVSAEDGSEINKVKVPVTLEP